ncbi:hypothetical protein M409DRAFT_53992 [Zasmidium cellare ATCC 36951]|uniref:Major facilitator superfamily (MFS) profile domain-containing protein n=1 Tax=Zasmidium cellare ATCC 36951 TaxID=1080233 RepID=A0A6A6CME7_ZASCE|nr:uncharacterized protein M409DRAFT_53992 [Zasmidium cellare ATCC 36951]KAF2167388.1 hypothetical protein M409DRAFT_53992 [Zasmidium cellare ATCC 36951]
MASQDFEKDNHSGDEEVANAAQDQSSEEPPQEPIYDKGTTAWLHVLGSFFLVFNTWGILNAFGEYQTYYASSFLSHESSSSISLIGSLETFILLFTSCLTGPVFDKGHLRLLVVVGTFLIVFGHTMLSGKTLTSCCPGIMYPIALYRLINEVSFPWAVRILGFIALATLLVPIFILRMRTSPAKARSLIDWTAFHDFDYIFLVFTSFLAYMGLFVLLFYLSFYAANAKLTDTSLAFYLVPIFNAGSCIGRTVPNALADKTGPFDIIAPGALIVGLLEFCMIAASNSKGMIALAVISGIFSGILIGVLPLCFIALTNDKSKLGTRMGMGFAFLGLGVLCAGPGAGAILGENEPLHWRSAWIFGGVATCSSGVGFSLLRFKKWGTRSILKA